jgi:hypothetical protein
MTQALYAHMNNKRKRKKKEDIQRNLHTNQKDKCSHENMGIK